MLAISKSMKASEIHYLLFNRIGIYGEQENILRPAAMSAECLHSYLKPWNNQRCITHIMLIPATRVVGDMLATLPGTRATMETWWNLLTWKTRNCCCVNCGATVLKVVRTHCPTKKRWNFQIIHAPLPRTSQLSPASWIRLLPMAAPEPLLKIVYTSSIDKGFRNYENQRWHQKMKVTLILLQQFKQPYSIEPTKKQQNPPTTNQKPEQTDKQHAT